VATREQENRLFWLILKNLVFFGLWIAALLSGCCVSAHDTAATWLMNALGVSPFLLSLMAISASLPFLLFALPAGVISDLISRKKLLIACYLWLAAAGLLALFTWFQVVRPYLILTAAFLLGIGFAFSGPVWAAIVPEIVRKSELPAAIILSGVQMNLGRIVGPALGGFLLRVAGPGLLFSLNALAFLFAAGMITRVYHERPRPQSHLENYLEAPITFERALALGLRVDNKISESMLQLMKLYPQPTRRQASVEYLPFRYRTSSADRPSR
jgi:MFS family permease